jgi:serine/threonine-protein kinase
MEYFPGDSLRGMVARGPIPLEKSIDIAEQVSRALETAHAQGIVHRDIKPENILVDEEALVKVVDFGLAYVLGASALTRPGAAPGTLVYMAPEQFMGYQVGPAADVYALGLVVYEMITGQPAFDHFDYASKTVKPPPRLPPDPVLGEDLAELIARCGVLEPGKRPRAGDLALGLGRLRARLSGSMKAMGNLPTSPVVPTPRERE